MRAHDVFLLHAYSPRNSGDGLLVKLSLEAIRAAGIHRRVTVVCLDKAAFANYLDDPDVELISLAEFVLRTAVRVVSRRPAIFFGVGGGYLRSGNRAEGWKALIAHGTQILCAAISAGSRTIYLPQSVGPFNGLPGFLLKRLIRRCVGTIFLRDDKSNQELRHWRGIRIGDLVVLEIARRVQLTVVQPAIDRQKVYFVFRDLSGKPYSDAYLRNVKRLAQLIPDAEFVLQSSGRGNSDDEFYRRVFGIECRTSLREALQQRDAIVVSVRLHGSLESVLAGVPSIHLSYERKGVAAYRDLGLDEYVFHASDFDPAAIATLVEQLRTVPHLFWHRLNTASANRYDELLEYIRNETRHFDHAADGRKFLASRDRSL
ncbi:polysaccharide pyruvyl transferase family protein [Paraburkholderia sp. SARCC-3016]|uniref:polysaccharide pyruvyl transferase family protein n=1 Tax=Paraburkholderia sp. SARCC-3016 TaxID=3058611 RepID=UPI0028071847|nr:polysaccharide pyruvyl transferase family protein [Paraburkholderia sp. SARCC-3016]MDQ7982199.1 polysaccharide pyruvyl transferase family protein [Paraburkholderia sp. SARCC-3016]